jgi:thiol-disulfide isomerase/thioredoxin
MMHGISIRMPVGRLSCLVRLWLGLWGVATLCCASLDLQAGSDATVSTNQLQLKVGDVFPDLKGFPLDGKLPASLKGRVAVIDFWASWCAPCQRTFPVMEDLHLRFKKQGLVILAINVDKSRVAMEEFLKEHPVTFDVVRDSKRELASRLRLPSLPCTFVVDRDGRIRSICTGFFSSSTKKQHVKLIMELLAQSPGEAPGAAVKDP